MDMEFLGDSDCISAAGYKGGYLTIEFTDGSIYTYESVPPQSWTALKKSNSKGYHFNKYVRNSYSFFEGQAPDSGAMTYIDAKYFDSLYED